MENSTWVVGGIMSGSSLDGVDYTVSKFNYSKDKWTFNIQSTNTVPLPKHLVEELKKSDSYSIKKLKFLDDLYGRYLGEAVNKINKTQKLIPSIIGLHGHTVFHEPKRGFSTQIANASIIANIINVEVISDFRNPNIGLGGQGAPLVPIGDKMLFESYKYCLNLGGIANISSKESDGRILAFDISYCNQALNYLANQLNLEYDNEGKIAESGKLDYELLKSLNSDPFLNLVGAKSLNNQDFKLKYKQNLDDCSSVANALFTYCEFISNHISKFLVIEGSTCLVTGGGAFNSFLMGLLKSKTKVKIFVPSSTIIESKESLIFAFLALLKKLNIPNVLAEYTGAQSDCISGTSYKPIEM
jgi:anhydro-N-acetylmuramic acid kinase